MLLLLLLLCSLHALAVIPIWLLKIINFVVVTSISVIFTSAEEGGNVFTFVDLFVSLSFYLSVF